MLISFHSFAIVGIGAKAIIFYPIFSCFLFYTFFFVFLLKFNSSTRSVSKTLTPAHKTYAVLVGARLNVCVLHVLQIRFLHLYPLRLDCGKWVKTASAFVAASVATKLCGRHFAGVLLSAAFSSVTATFLVLQLHRTVDCATFSLSCTLQHKKASTE